MNIGIRYIVVIFVLLLSLSSFAGDLSDLKNVDFNGRKPKIGFFIGSYDPIHLHHQQIIEQAQKLGGLDYVIVIPNDTAFHKPMVSPVNHRVNMLDIVFSENDKILVPLDGDEFQFPMVRTIRKFLKDNLGEYDAVGIMGKDSAVRKNSQIAAYVAGFDRWLVTEAEEVAGVVPVKMGGKPVTTVHIKVSEDFPSAHSSAIRNFMLKNPSADFPGVQNMPIDKRIYIYSQKYELYSKPHTRIAKAKGFLGCIKMAGQFPIF